MKALAVFKAGRDRAEHLLKLAELLTKHSRPEDAERLGEGLQEIHALEAERGNRPS